MSLINKMLQELDARGTPAGGAFQVPAKTVEREPSRLDLRARLAAHARPIALVAASALGGVALAWSGWTFWQHRHPAAAKPGPVPVPAAAPAPAPAPSAVAVHGIQPAEAAEAAPAAPAPAAEAVRPAAARPAPTSAGPGTAPGKAHAKESKTGHQNRHDDRFGGAEAPAARGARAKSVAPLEPDSTEARALRQALAQELDARKAPAGAAKPRNGGAATRAAVLAHAAARPGAGVAPDEMQGDQARTAAFGRQESAGQRAEGQYRRALASMQEGRLTETIAALEAALHIDPGHEAARQTLVGLLVEAGRLDEAMRQLQLGLSLDPRQPALAMLLARLQIERGESGLQSGIDTLMRTLPFAGNDPDYRAVLAGALQRQGRHREAAEQYAQALRGAGKAVWWMGMGISLQADKRNGEALDAFRKARAAGLSSQELQAFVERRIQQLER